MTHRVAASAVFVAGYRARSIRAAAAAAAKSHTERLYRKMRQPRRQRPCALRSRWATTNGLCRALPFGVVPSPRDGGLQTTRVRVCRCFFVRPLRVPPRAFVIAFTMTLGRSSCLIVFIQIYGSVTTSKRIVIIPFASFWMELRLFAKKKKIRHSYLLVYMCSPCSFSWFWLTRAWREENLLFSQKYFNIKYF